MRCFPIPRCLFLLVVCSRLRSWCFSFLCVRSISAPVASVLVILKASDISVSADALASGIPFMPPAIIQVAADTACTGCKTFCIDVVHSSKEELFLYLLCRPTLRQFFDAHHT